MYRLLTFLIIAMLVLSGCAAKEETASKPEETETLEGKDIGQKVLKFDLTSYADRGAKRWEVKGESADMVDDLVELKNITATTYGKKNILTLRADEGLYNKALNKIHLEKNVIITSEDGARVLADEMDWDSQTNVITTDSLIEIERDEIKLWGRCAKGEPELKQVRFEKNIRIEMDEGATVITCDGPMDIDYEKNSAIFNNNVKIVDEKGEVTAEKLIAHLNPETKAIVKATAKGNVKILRGENYSYSEEALYLAEEHRVILSGRPQLVIYPEERLDTSLFDGSDER